MRRLSGASRLTKNKDWERDPKMHQTAMGKQWYFWRKAHIGVDSRTKFIHTILASAANLPDASRCRTCCMAGRLGFGAIRHTLARRQ
jgi:hypothetical protein